jgi:hypothetical protein
LFAGAVARRNHSAVIANIKPAVDQDQKFAMSTFASWQVWGMMRLRLAMLNQSVRGNAMNERNE